MKKSLLFFLFAFTSVCGFAQKGKDCLYHIKFYNWQWDYCMHKGYDTVPKYSKLTGAIVGDTIFFRAAYQALPNPGLTIPFPIPDSFTISDIPLTVTNAKGTKKLEVEKFAIGYIDNSPHLDSIHGSVAETNVLKKLQHAFTTYSSYNSNSVIWLEIKLKGVAKPITTEDAPIRPVISAVKKPAEK